MQECSGNCLIYCNFLKIIYIAIITAMFFVLKKKSILREAKTVLLLKSSKLDLPRINVRITHLKSNLSVINNLSLFLYAFLSSFIHLIIVNG